MKIKALQDFNLGSLEKDYKQGQTVEVTPSVGKELIDAGLAKEVGEKAPEDKAEKAARQTKPDAPADSTK